MFIPILKTLIIAIAINYFDGFETKSQTLLTVVVLHTLFTIESNINFLIGSITYVPSEWFEEKPESRDSD